MRGAAALLKPGGRLVLLELHPLLCMPETIDPLVIDFPYVNDGVRHYEGTGSYANPEADLSWSIDQYAWSIGETVNAAIEAGLGIVRLVSMSRPVRPARRPPHARGRRDVPTADRQGSRRGAGPSRCRCCSRLVGREGTLTADEPAG